MSEGEIKGPPSAESKLTWGRIVAGLCALATIIGGVAAGIQIYREAEDSPPKSYLERTKEPPKETLEAGWRRESLEGGMTVALPQTWKPVDRDGLISLLKSTGSPNADAPFASLGPADLISFVVEQNNDPNAPTVFAAFGAIEDSSSQTIDEQVESLRNNPRFQTASKVTLPQGDAIHAILKEWMRGPDGYEIPLIVDSYIIPKYGRQWIAMLYMQEHEHLPYSGTFRKIVETFRAPIPEPPPPG